MPGTAGVSLRVYRGLRLLVPGLDDHNAPEPGSLAPCRPQPLTGQSLQAQSASR